MDEGTFQRRIMTRGWSGIFEAYAHNHYFGGVLIKYKNNKDKDKYKIKYCLWYSD
jgi:hypothetical protein